MSGASNEMGLPSVSSFFCNHSSVTTSPTKYCASCASLPASLCLHRSTTTLWKAEKMFLHSMFLNMGFCCYNSDKEKESDINFPLRPFQKSAPCNVACFCARYFNTYHSFLSFFTLSILIFLQKSSSISYLEFCVSCLKYTTTFRSHILTTLTQYECPRVPHPTQYLPISSACSSQMFPQMKFRLTGLDPKVSVQ